jgi:hypothetical protein
MEPAPKPDPLGNIQGAIGLGATAVGGLCCIEGTRGGAVSRTARSLRWLPSPVILISEGETLEIVDVAVSGVPDVGEI